MTKVQVCGLRTLEDAIICEKAGVDSLGFVNVEGRSRSIQLEEIKDIIDGLGPMILTTLIGFPKNADDIIKKADFVGADAVQTYTLGIGELEKVRDHGFRVYRALSIDIGTGNLEVTIEGLSSFAEVSDIIVFESSFKKVVGGLGLSYDYEGIISPYKKYCGRFGIAGGLNPQNVSDALKIEPYSVDVSSGVEAKLGKKSEEKVIEFVKRCTN
jgi:phosphoribosylanthranilate isomerase